MFVKIPVFWAEDDFEKKEEIFGDKAKIEFTEGFMVINTNHICAYHPDDENFTMIRLSNGDVMRSPIAFDVFEKMFPELLSVGELYISSEN